ncbi:MAG: SMP-30/gluconolactonase/LRE family protein [Saprospiraceae bacterium]|nr:SMP-30/gluconolactonase/LRE family protein [Saprospiraceae bacterium]
MIKKVAKIFLVILLIVGSLGLKSYYDSGGFKTINNHFDGKMQKISGLVGVEDITIDPTTGITFLSSEDRWAKTIDKKPTKGTIYTLNLNDSILTPLSKTSDFSADNFHPHGISLYQTSEGKKLLFVINHLEPEGHQIEIFEYKNDSLQHRETIKDPLLVSPNDIVAVSEHSFYVTNDHNEKLSKMRTAKDIAQIGTGNICYFDGQKMQKTGIEGLKYANGINKTADGAKIFVAETTAKRIRIFDRNITTGALTQEDEINTNTGVDNIEVDTEGSLWVGCHPQMLKFMGHSKDENKPSPSEIIKIRRLGKGKYEQTTVYMNDGSEISASSVGAFYKDKLLVGGVFQRHFLVGRLKM